MSLSPTSPVFLTVRDTAALLRTTPKAIYTLIERGRLPAVRRLHRRVLIDRAELLRSLDHNRTPSLEEKKR